MPNTTQPVCNIESLGCESYGVPDERPFGYRSYICPRRSKFSFGRTQLDSTETPSADRLRNQVKTYLNAGALQRKGLRELLIQELQGAPNAAALGVGVMQECVASPRPGRLDDAIDILSGAAVSAMAMARPLAPNGNWAELADDIQYILVSVAGRSSCVSEGALVMSALSRLTGGGCEAAIISLGESRSDIRDAMLRWVYQRSNSSTLRCLAQDYLAESTL